MLMDCPIFCLRNSGAELDGNLQFAIAAKVDAMI